MASFGLGSGGGNASTIIPTADIDASTPFMAASEGNLELLKTSLQHLNNQPSTIADENGYTLLHAAASYNHHAIIQWLLLEMEKNIPETTTSPQSYLHAMDKEGDTCLHYAGNVDTARILVKLSPTLLTIPNKQGKTPLQAKQEEHNECMADDDEDEEDIEMLKQLVEYLSGVSSRAQ